MLPVLKFYMESFVFCFSDILVLFGFFTSSAGEVNKVEKSLVETGKQSTCNSFQRMFLKNYLQYQMVSLQSVRFHSPPVSWPS